MGVCLSRSSIEGGLKKGGLLVFSWIRLVLWFILVLDLYGLWEVGC